MIPSQLAPSRKSYLSIGALYFWTATIHQWHRLLWQDDYKEIVLQSLIHLSKLGKTDVFAFVIMPNHIHLIWRINELNGKETTQGSFLKFTAHEFKKKLCTQQGAELSRYQVTAPNKQYEFWQRDSLAIPLYSKAVAYQKLDYLHNNPLANHWQLAKDPCDYLYSSARFYESREHHFSFLKDLRAEF